VLCRFLQLLCEFLQSDDVLAHQTESANAARVRKPADLKHVVLGNQFARAAVPKSRSSNSSSDLAPEIQ